jgi:hypothetical protein
VSVLVTREQLADWQRRLRLSDWHIAISTEEPEPDDRSCIDMDLPIRQAVIRFRSDTPASQVERQLVHELLHALLGGMRDAYDAARSYAPSSHDDAARRLWDRGCEFAIEALCDALTGSRRADWGPSGSPWNEAFRPDPLDRPIDSTGGSQLP